MQMYLHSNNHTSLLDCLTNNEIESYCSSLPSSTPSFSDQNSSSPELDGIVGLIVGFIILVVLLIVAIIIITILLKKVCVICEVDVKSMFLYLCMFCLLHFLLGLVKE